MPRKPHGPELPPNRRPEGSVLTGALMLIHERMALEELRDLLAADGRVRRA